ncbi:hypothetical protein MGA5115_01112 [Marinomonas gallaica]|uniref:DUF1294 domain-containing protein n=1 Tax=Marinomonas gallaica TaxID=1806667 RepID=A0A1C3JPA7_9GAMM|nr:DUF1294 domain-containing protein [Marinomonas gallaica]SBT17024.1 hypothetical protein MGA5115_01112 [Marinomonas gallaica]SBT20669.1 hypothetical protein MGA5116_01256 [Marinomonas gallaica]
MPPIYAKWLSISTLLSLTFGALNLITAIWLNRQITLFVELKPLYMWLLISFAVSQNVFLMPLLYWYDKRQSKQRNKERIPELVLHILALLGGGLGALYGQTHFRHKTQKPMFKATAWLGIIIIGYVGYLVGQKQIG